MYLQHPHHTLYAAFDVFPSSKGAATHITHFAETLFSVYGNGWLHTLGDGEMLPYQDGENQVEITRFQEVVPNFLERTTLYSEQLYAALRQYSTTLLKDLQLCHFRDIWSGLPILAYQNEIQENNKGVADKNNKTIKTIFEVNSLPSIELLYRYQLSTTTIEKIKALEMFCLQTANQLIVPSEVIRNFLLKKGIDSQKIQVIYNGANLPTQLAKPAETPAEYIIYFGALQTWQGVSVLLRAFALLQDKEKLHLVLCVSLKEKFSKNLQKLAEKLGISHKLIWQYRLNKTDLQSWISGAMFSVAPLTECSRNLEQGCCPLKILESMACGVPVIASNLPVTRELITNNENGKLVRADRPADLARSMRILYEETAFRQTLGQKAQQTIAEKFTWEQKKQELLEVYKRMVV
jgi:glycosyltransferase involved in cell wall biosynthesis